MLVRSTKSCALHKHARLNLCAFKLVKTESVKIFDLKRAVCAFWLRIGKALDCFPKENHGFKIFDFNSEALYQGKEKKHLLASLFFLNVNKKKLKSPTIKNFVFSFTCAATIPCKEKAQPRPVKI